MRLSDHSGGVSSWRLGLMIVAIAISGCSVSPPDPLPTGAGLAQAMLERAPDYCSEVAVGQVACTIPRNAAGEPAPSRMTCASDIRHRAFEEPICDAWSMLTPVSRMLDGRRRLNTSLCSDTSDTGACRRWKTGRPFDGADVGVIDHPWCERWENDRTICTRTDGGGLSCAQRTGDNLHVAARSSSVFYCRAWKPAEWCDLWTDGTTQVPRAEFEGGIVLTAPQPRALKYVRCLKTRD